MSSNAIFFSWARVLPGREAASGQLFQDFVEYLSTQQRNGMVESFEPVFLEPHGGMMNGFFLIRGEASKLAEMTATPEWARYQVRGAHLLERSATVKAMVGASLQERMALWMKEVPKQPLTEST